MNEKTEKEAEVKSDVIFVHLEFDTRTKAFGIKSNAPDPVYQMGMLAFASAQVGKPKESAIKPAAAIPAGLQAPGRG